MNCENETLIDCRKAVEHMMSFVDRELSDDEAMMVKMHIEKCEHCRDAFKIEESVLIHIRKCCQEVPMPEHLEQAILSSLREP